MRGHTKTRTKLPSAMEMVVLTPKENGQIELEVFFRIRDEWTPFLERLIENNVFPWLMWGQRTKEHLYQRSTSWCSRSELSKHLDAEMVIYYLADTKAQELYVGRANRLGDRVRPGRPEIPGWDKFRYDIVRPQYAHLLDRIEENTIRAFASVIKNKRALSSLQLGEYALVNRDIRRLD